jgi:hypothetical protein
MGPTGRSWFITSQYQSNWGKFTFTSVKTKPPLEKAARAFYKNAQKDQN